MEIDQLKSLCEDPFEAKLATEMYKYGLKSGDCFEVSVVIKEDIEYIQKFDKRGNPIGKPTKSQIKWLRFDDILNLDEY